MLIHSCFFLLIDPSIALDGEVMTFDVTPRRHNCNFERDRRLLYYEKLFEWFLCLQKDTRNLRINLTYFY